MVLTITLYLFMPCPVVMRSSEYSRVFGVFLEWTIKIIGNFNEDLIKTSTVSLDVKSIWLKATRSCGIHRDVTNKDELPKKEIIYCWAQNIMCINITFNKLYILKQIVLLIFFFLYSLFSHLQANRRNEAESSVIWFYPKNSSKFLVFSF